MPQDSGRVSRREMPTVEIYTMIEMADELIDDLQAEVQSCDDALTVTREKADRRRANPRRVARVYSEGGVDALEKEFSDAAEEDEDSGSGGGSGGSSGGGPRTWKAREELIGLWTSMRGDEDFRNALLNMRHDVRRANDSLKELHKRGRELRNHWQTAYDAMADLQNAMADGMSAVRVEKVPNWTNDVSFDRRVSELRAIADAATGKTYQVTPSPDGPGAHDDD